ncbi:alpha-tocopherol transfer protein-like [Schistocerca cancellata]|uniref:alpha-tocopherol transfer protein-like n=1 Tax=Schistocerca cancellata TaxID=274614 RepID=UPI00211863EF|nr:alpha-tocopherol transfer protein-like [Schistocerca cancellata]
MDLTPELQKRAEQDLNEDPRRRGEDIKHIRDWLSKQPHIKARTDDAWLLAFLRGCEFSLERTKERLDNYYTLRSLMPEVFDNRDPLSKELVAAVSARVLLELPEPDEQGSRVFLLRLGAADPATIPVERVFKLNYMAGDLMLRDDPAAIICGNVILLDLDGANMGHVLQMTPAFVSKIMTILQEAYPLRTLAIHYINAPSAVDVVMSLFKNSLSGYLATQFHQHTDLESLHKFFPKRILPKEYGGEAGTLAELNERFRKRLESRRDFFLEDGKYGVDEKLRPTAARSKARRDVFDMAGSFRQLAVD